MSTTRKLILTAKEFSDQLDASKSALGPQGFTWYPYDSFGYLLVLDSLLKGRIDILRKLAADEPALDVGCGDGALSFFLESLGCEVDAIDNPPTNYNGMRGIAKLKEKLGSKVSIYSMDIDARFDPPRPLYGLTLLLGVLYHLKNPFYVLEKLAAHSRYCLLGTRVARVTPSGAKMQRDALAYLVDDLEMNADPTNFWIFSEEGLKRIVRRAGWEIREFLTEGCLVDSDPVRGDRDERAFCVLESKKLEPRHPAVLLRGWHQLEDNWRWTAREFSLELNHDPLGDAQTLEFRFNLMERVLAATGPVTLGASVNGRALSNRVFDTAGEHVYNARVPPGTSDSKNNVCFKLDKSYSPGPPDLRELGLLVSFYKPGFETSDGNVPVRLV